MCDKELRSDFGYQCVTYSENPITPVGRKILLNVSTKQSRVEKMSAPRGPQAYIGSGHPDVPSVCRYQKKRNKRRCGSCMFTRVFELCLTHNWKAITLQRPQNYFCNSNKCKLLVGSFKMAQTRSPRRWYAVLIGGYFFLTHNDFLLERQLTAKRQELGWG